MRWWKQEQRKWCSENGWKLLRMTVFGLGAEDGPHVRRQTAAAKKTGPTVTKELSEELLFSANKGGKGLRFAAAGALLQLRRPEKCPRRCRETEEASKHYPWRASSIKAASWSPFPHLFPPPCTGHSSLQLHQPRDFQQLGQQVTHAPSNPTGMNLGLSPSWVPPAQPKPCHLLLLQPLWILKNFGYFGFKTKSRKNWELSINSPQKQLSTERTGRGSSLLLPLFLIHPAVLTLLIKLSEAPVPLNGFGNSSRNSRSSFSNLTHSLHKIKYERTPMAEIVDNVYPIL